MGLESTPKEVLQNFLGGKLPLAGVKPPDPPPSNTALPLTRHMSAVTDGPVMPSVRSNG